MREERVLGVVGWGWDAIVPEVRAGDEAGGAVGRGAGGAGDEEAQHGVAAEVVRGAGGVLGVVDVVVAVQALGGRAGGDGEGDGGAELGGGGAGARLSAVLFVNVVSKVFGWREGVVGGRGLRTQELESVLVRK